MGLTKRWLEEQEERGWFSVADRWVCQDCINEPALQDLVAASATSCECSYCGQNSLRPFAAELDTVVEAIVRSLRTEFDQPTNQGVPWEGGWALGPVHDSWDLLTDLEVGADWDLIRDISDSLGDAQWCQRNFYRLRPDAALLYGWQHFATEIRAGRDISDPGDQDPDLQPLAEVLSGVTRFVREAKALRVLPAGTRLFRARVRAPRESFVPSAATLGPAPAERAGSNRMSKRGESMFYGAFDPLTPVLEVGEHGEQGVVGDFRLTRQTVVVDLADVGDVPSLFDEALRDLRPARLFLHDFATEIARPNLAGDQDYVPTQMVTAHLRTLATTDGPVMGVVYRSVRNQGGACVTLFVGPDEMASRTNPDGWLTMDGFREFP